MIIKHFHAAEHARAGFASLVHSVIGNERGGRLRIPRPEKRLREARDGGIDGNVETRDLSVPVGPAGIVAAAPADLGHRLRARHAERAPHELIVVRAVWLVARRMMQSVASVVRLFKDHACPSKQRGQQQAKCKDRFHRFNRRRDHAPFCLQRPRYHQDEESRRIREA